MVVFLSRMGISIKVMVFISRGGIPIKQWYSYHCGDTIIGGGKPITENRIFIKKWRAPENIGSTPIMHIKKLRAKIIQL